MIVLNISNALAYNIGIDAFSSIITLVIYHSYKRDFANTNDICLLRKIEMTVLLIIFADMGMWALDGKEGSFMRALSYMTGIFFFVMEIAVTLGWLRYAWHRIFGRNIQREKEFYYVLLPFTVLGLLVISSPLTGWCFYLDPANYYHRGLLSTLLYAILLAYLMSISVMALTQYKKETLIDRKQELLTIAFFPVPPFIGGLMQTVFFGLSLIWPCAVFSCLLVLLNKESQAISQDSLTGLNNRRSMEKYLHIFEEDSEQPVTLIMLDINNFKEINDQYGHIIGDAALIEAANILRTVFRGTTAFLARYGGDEFVVIMPEGEESTVVETIGKIRKSFDSFSKTEHFPFGLSVSAGYAISTQKSDNRTVGLLKEADENMYRDKALYFSGKHPNEDTQKLCNQ